MSGKIDWSKDNILFFSDEVQDNSDNPDKREIRKVIEPWLTAIFQSEHLSLLIGSGLTTGICRDALRNTQDAEKTIQGMQLVRFETYGDEIRKHAAKEAERLKRGSPNFEDNLRAAINLLKGLKVIEGPETDALKREIDRQLKLFITGVIDNEKEVQNSERRNESLMLLRRFLVSFCSRTSSRDRLHIFTTNYDRFIEYALDNAGIYILDRFVGNLNPIMRMHKMELDYHYNPPGIRGEPRYVDGVVRYTKLHGSVDWKFEGREIYKIPLPFGHRPTDNLISEPYETCVIYPNASKDIETTYFPYSELFRDFSTAICRPNSSLVIFGYGFGDSHINNIILDMMAIPSTHLVIIGYNPKNGRLQDFIRKCNLSQLTLLLGKDYSDIRILTDNYLPKSAIDRISNRYYGIKEKRLSSEHTDERMTKGGYGNATQL